MFSKNSFGQGCARVFILVITLAVPVLAMKKPVISAHEKKSLVSKRPSMSSAQRCARAFEKFREERLEDSVRYDLDANRSLMDQLMVAYRLNEQDVQELMVAMQKKFPFNLAQMREFFLQKKEQCRLESQLRCLAQTGSKDQIKNCLIQGPQVDAPDEQGRTALLLAAKAGNKSAVKLLLKVGADAKVVDDNEQSALDLAVKTFIDFEPSVELLKIFNLLKSPEAA